MSPHWHDLIQNHLAGRTTPEEVLALQEALKTDAELRALYLDYMNLDVALEAMAEEMPQAKIVRFPLRPLVVMAAAACVIFGVALFWHSTQKPYATVAGGVGIQASMEGIRGEPHELKDGILELTTARGAKVVIEAPASFQFRVRAKTPRASMAAWPRMMPSPSAKGFTVIAHQQATAVDLGTKFGVDVPLQGDAEVHVFQGEVIAQSSGGGKRQSLRGGEAYALQNGARRIA